MTGRGLPRIAAPLAWTAVLAGGLALACVVAPPVYAALKAVAPDLGWPPSRVFNRVAMGSGALMLVLFRRSVGWEELRELLGRASAERRAAETAVGLVAALLGVGLALAWAFATGQLGRALQDYSYLSARTASTLVGGLAAALIEESFFRGMMLPRLTAALGWRAAALASSAIYALVHLLISDPTFAWQGSSPGEGFHYLAHAVARQVEPASMAVLAGLFLLGLVLAGVVRRSGSLYLAVGLHAGWILAFQVSRHATRPLLPIPGSTLLAARQYLVGRPWAWAALLISGALALAWAHWRWRGRGESTAPPA